MANQNLERDCALYGFEMVDEAKVLQGETLSTTDKSTIINTLNKALGVLNSDGPFAYLIWLEYRKSLNPGVDLEEKTARLIHQKSYEILKMEDFVDESKWHNPDYTLLREIFTGKDGDDSVQGICENIHQLFFVKGILEKMLTYALYRSRALQARENDEEPQPSKEE